jgi:hypothetical protein
MQPPKNPLRRKRDRLVTAAPDRAFPHGKTPPPQSAKCLFIADITQTVTVNFLPPKLSSGFREAKSAAIMTVPKTAVDEYRSPEFSQHEVWPTGKHCGMKTEAHAAFMQSAAQNHFWLGIAAANGSHVPASYSLAVHVSH